jgi:hypothetical protein
VAWALAASLLLGFGVLLGRAIWSRPDGQGGEVLLAALQPGLRVERDGSHRSLPGVGGEYQLDATVKPGEAFEVTVESPRSGFATVIMLAPGNLRVWPRPGGEIRVEAFRPTLEGPLTLPAGSFAVLVVVTPTPATDKIREMLPADGAPADRAGEILSDLQDRLLKQGLPWVAVNRASVQKVDKGGGG